jgi:hypothetical protein
MARRRSARPSRHSSTACVRTIIYASDAIFHLAGRHGGVVALARHRRLIEWPARSSTARSSRLCARSRPPRVAPVGKGSVRATPHTSVRRTLARLARHQSTSGLRLRPSRAYHFNHLIWHSSRCVLALRRANGAVKQTAPRVAQGASIHGCSGASGGALKRAARHTDAHFTFVPSAKAHRKQKRPSPPSVIPFYCICLASCS